MSRLRLPLLFAALVLLACEIPASALPLLVPPAPTLDDQTFNRMVAQTAAAAATQTALFAPTPYLSPTLVPTFTPIITTTPSPVPTLTPTFLFLIASPTKPKPTATRTSTAAPTSVAGGKYSCQLVSQEPDNGAVFNPNADFDGRWRVRNTGTSKWDQNSTDYRYASGDKFHQQGAYDFPKTVPVGDAVNLIVDMRAPKNAGTYTTRWEIRIGDNHFCTMRLTIEVD